MKTQYASGRSLLPTPTITSESGNVQGNSTVYYFWIKARNRVGFNQPSSVTTLTLSNNSAIRISTLNFVKYDWEDWISFHIFTSKTNNFSTSRQIYKQDLYLENQVDLATLNDVVITSDYVLNGNIDVTNESTLLTLNVPNGFRARLINFNRVFEFKALDTVENANNITILPGSNGNWYLVSNNSLTENTVTSNKDVIEVTDDEFIAAPIESVVNAPVALKYWIVNNTINPITTGQLNLKEYYSDKSISAKFNVEIIGYLNLNTFTLDTNNIDNVNSIVIYPDEDIQISKPLPPNSALVLNITPDIFTSYSITQGNYISLYPAIDSYTLVSSVKDFDSAVNNLTDLKALNRATIKHNQIRYIVSNNVFYRFDSNSTLEDNGNTIISPNGANPEGRWLVTGTAISPSSIGLSELKQEVINYLDSSIKTETININSFTYVLNLDNSTTDYFIFNLPTANQTNTVVNIDIVKSNLTNNNVHAVLIELRHNTATPIFSNSILFNAGAVPSFSPANKIDLLLIEFVKDSSGVLKKRAFIIGKDIG